MHKALPLDLGRAGIASVVADPEAPLVEFSLHSPAGPSVTWQLTPNECRELADTLDRPRSHEVHLVFRAATIYANVKEPGDWSKGESDPWCSLSFLTVPGPSVGQRVRLSDCQPLAELLRWAADGVAQE